MIGKHLELQRLNSQANMALVFSYLSGELFFSIR